MFVKIQIVDLWVMTFCILVCKCQYFGGTCRLPARPDVRVDCIAQCHNPGHHTVDNTTLLAQVFCWI